jgi:transposase
MLLDFSLTNTNSGNGTDQQLKKEMQYNLRGSFKITIKLKDKTAVSLN